MARWSRVGILVAVGCALASPARALDDDVRVPIPLQAALLSKVARYDGRLPGRAGDAVRVRVLHKADDARSRLHALQLRDALAGQTLLPGRSQQVEVASLGTSASLAAQVDAEHLALVVLSTGFTPAEVRAVAEALAGRDVLSASLDPAVVEAGAILGFDVASGKPVILVNLRQAQRQKVQLAASLLALVKVVP